VLSKFVQSCEVPKERKVRRWVHRISVV